MHLDHRRVPPAVRPVLALAELWGISDDYEREDAVRRATVDDLQELVAAVDSLDSDFWEWLSGPASSERRPSTEYVAITALTMAADSARIKLHGGV